MVIKMRRIYFDNKYGYESLAQSIVLQAVKDYIRSYREVLKNPRNDEGVRRLHRVKMVQNAL